MIRRLFRRRSGAVVAPNSTDAHDEEDPVMSARSLSPPESFPDTSTRNPFDESVGQNGQLVPPDEEHHILGRNDAALLWRQRLLRGGVFLALLASAGLGAGLSFVNGRVAQIRSFDEHYEQVAYRLGDEMAESFGHIARTGITLASTLSSIADAAAGTGPFALSAFQLLNMSPATTAMSQHVIFRNRTTPELMAVLKAFADAFSASGLQQSPGCLANLLSQGFFPPDTTAGRAWMPALQVVARPSDADAAAASLGAAAFTSGLLADAAADPALLSAVQRSLASGAATLTDTFTNGSSATLFVPVPANASLPSLLSACLAGDAAPQVVPAAQFDGASVRRLVAVSFSFPRMLGSVLSPNIPTSVTVVVASPTGAALTFTVVGSAVVSVGEGDRHERVDYLDAYERRVPLGVSGWHASVYPTVQLRERFVTVAPARDAIVIGGVILLASLIFGWYEFYVQARSSNLIRELKDTLERLFTLNSRLHVAIVEQRAEAELRIKAESAAVEKQRMFVMMISHEIRTPLNALLGAAQLLADTEMNGEQVELMELLAAGANHVVLIVDDILNYGAIQSGNFPLAFEPLDVARAVVEPAWRMIGMSRTHKEKLRTLKLRKSIAPDVPAVIVGDAPRLVQVLTNLLNNSIKFTNEGGTIELEVRVSRKAPNVLAGAGASVTGHPVDASLYRRSQDVSGVDHDAAAAAIRGSDTAHSGGTAGPPGGTVSSLNGAGWGEGGGQQGGLILGGLDLEAEMSHAQQLLSRAMSIGRHAQGPRGGDRRASFSASDGKKGGAHLGGAQPQATRSRARMVNALLNRSHAAAEAGGLGFGFDARGVAQSQRLSNDLDAGPLGSRGASGVATAGGESARFGGVGGALAAAFGALPRLSSSRSAAGGGGSFIMASLRAPVRDARQSGVGLSAVTTSGIQRVVRSSRSILPGPPDPQGPGLALGSTTGSSLLGQLPSGARRVRPSVAFEGGGADGGLAAAQRVPTAEALSPPQLAAKAPTGAEALDGATPQQPPRPTLPIRLLSRVASTGASSTAGAPDVWLQFIVRDNGIGIAPDAIERIFEPFQQAELNTVRKYGGTGLGLTICRALARCMGGEMTAWSPGLGMGSTFTFTIPAVLAPAGALEASPGQIGAVPQGPRLSVTLPTAAAGPSVGWGGTPPAARPQTGAPAAVAVARSSAEHAASPPPGAGAGGDGDGADAASAPAQQMTTRDNALFGQEHAEATDGGRPSQDVAADPLPAHADWAAAGAGPEAAEAKPPPRSWEDEAAPATGSISDRAVHPRSTVNSSVDSSSAVPSHRHASVASSLGHDGRSSVSAPLGLKLPAAPAASSSRRTTSSARLSSAASWASSGTTSPSLRTGWLRWRRSAGPRSRSTWSSWT